MTPDLVGIFVFISFFLVIAWLWFRTNSDPKICYIPTNGSATVRFELSITKHYGAWEWVVFDADWETLSSTSNRPGAPLAYGTAKRKELAVSAAMSAIENWREATDAALAVEHRDRERLVIDSGVPRWRVPVPA